MSVIRNRSRRSKAAGRIAVAAGLLAAALAAASAGGCKVPPFHEDVAQAALLTGQMRLEGRVGPIDMDGGFELLDELRYVPVNTDFESGYLLRDRAQLEIGFVEQDGDLLDVALDQSILEFDNSGEYELAYLAQTVASTGPYLALANVLPTFVAPAWRVNILEFDHQLDPPGPVGTDAVVLLDALIAGPVIDDVVGCSIAPMQDPSVNRIYFLCRDSAVPTDFYQASYDLVSFDPAIQGGVQIHGGPVTGLDEPANVRYYYDPDQGSGGTGVGQYRMGGEWRTFRWDDTTLGSPIQVEIPQRIDAMLSTGWLFCRDEDNAYLYDLKGDSVNRFHMGDLELAHEVWDDDEGEFRTVFVHGYFAGYSGESGLYYEVYSVETEDLEDIN